jgi:hypothetical protein
MLYDTPSDVKSAFNNVVEYFDKGKNKPYLVCAEVIYNYKGGRGKVSPLEGYWDVKEDHINAPNALEAERDYKKWLEKRSYKIIRIKAFRFKWRKSPRGRDIPEYNEEAIRKWKKATKQDEKYRKWDL